MHHHVFKKTCVWVCVEAKARAIEFPKLELQEIMNCLMLVLGIELRSFARAACDFNYFSHLSNTCALQLTHLRNYRENKENFQFGS